MSRLLKKDNKKTFKRVINLIGPYKYFLIPSIFMAGITVALTLYLPILIGNAIDKAIGKKSVDFTGLLRVLLVILIIIFVTGICQWIMNITNNYIVYNVTKDIRIKAFNKINRLPISFIDSHPHGDIISRVIADVDTFTDGLLMGFTQLFTGVMTILGTLGFMFYLNYKIALVVVCITPLSLLVASFIAKKTFYMFREQSKERGNITSLIDEMVTNQKVVKIFGQEKENIEKFDKINEKLAESSLKATFYSSITNPATRFVNGIVYAGVGIFGAIASIKGLISVGQLTSFLSYANQYTKPFNEISGVITELQNSLACAQRVFDLLDEKSMRDESKLEKLSSANGNVDINNVEFSYVPDKKLITNFNLNVLCGKRVAIVGPTGCGKSTLINLLMRFYDVDNGDILVDKKSIYSITKNSLRKNYGMVLQETWLKTGTIAENIAYGKSDAKREDIIKAAKESYAHNFIKKLPNGYDTLISEDGGNLSQGEKQLLCIARVMLNIPPMLILDEATSNIDTRTEIKVQNAFQKLMEGRTSFIVAHRLSTIKEADIILVMKDGHIIEKGTHNSLLHNKGFYYELYNSQFKN